MVGHRRRRAGPRPGGVGELGVDLDDVDPVALGVALSQLSPGHPAVVAARLAVDVAEGRDREARLDRDMSKALSEVVDWKAEASEFLAQDRALSARAEWEATCSVPAQRHIAETRGSSADDRQRRLDAMTTPPRPDPLDYPDALSAAVAEARQWAADRAAYEEELERRAVEARWVAEDHAEEVAALEAAHSHQLSA